MNEVHAAIFLQPRCSLTYEEIDRVLSQQKTTLMKAVEALKNTNESSSEYLKIPLVEYCETPLNLAIETEMRYLKVMEQQLTPDEITYKRSQVLNDKVSRLEEMLNFHIEAIQEALDRVRIKKTDHSLKNYLQVEEAASPPVRPFDGPSTRYYVTGQLKAQQFYLEGQLHGDSCFFTPEGLLLAKSVFEHGLREGETLQYYRSGRLYAKQHWKNGKKEGVHCYYYENGMLHADIPYREGTLHGDLVIYYPEGIKKYEAQFQLGMREGEVNMYHTSGHLFEKYQYRHGKLMTYRQFYLTGQVYIEQFYDEEGGFSAKEWSLEGQLLSDKQLKGLLREEEALDLKKAIDDLLKELT